MFEKWASAIFALSTLTTAIVCLKKANHQQLESALESSPSWLTSSYIHSMLLLKKCLKAMGFLTKLDALAKTSQRFHYLRSLLAIHQLDDMVSLDVPWWTYDAIKAIEHHIQQLDYKPLAFEYGSGASTIWLGKRCSEVVSIEHDKQWYDSLKNKLDIFPSVTLALQIAQPHFDKKYCSQKISNVSFQNYVESINQHPQLYDLIIIDGRCREACLENCLAYLKPNGIIVFDNSNRKRYQQTINNCGLEIQRFYGQVPGSPFKSETAILRKSK